jgi:hypothetical protein
MGANTESDLLQLGNPLCTKRFTSGGNRSSHHGHTGNTRHSPRNGFTAYFVLSPVTGLVCHRRPRGLPPRKLDTSVGVSGPHDFAVRKHTLSSVAWFASTASRPNVRDDGQRPSFGTGRRSFKSDLGQARREIFLRTGLDAGSTDDGDLPDGQITGLTARPGITRSPDVVRRMPPPPRTSGPPVANIRNASSPDWRGRLKPKCRCVVPADSFAEYSSISPAYLSSVTSHKSWRRHRPSAWLARCR